MNIRIDTDGVAAFGRTLRHDDGYASARARDLHAHGVEWGSRIASGPIHDARGRYADALAGTEANLRVYPQAAAVLASVAEQIAKEFASADLNAAAAQQRIESLLSGAIARAQQIMGEKR